MIFCLELEDLIGSCWEVVGAPEDIEVIVASRKELGKDNYRRS